MCRENSGNFVLVDFIPAAAGDMILLCDHEQRRQVTGEGKALVEEDGHAIVAVTWRGNDLSGDPNVRQKFPAVFEFQNQIVTLCDLNVGKVLAFEEFGKWSNEINLALDER